MCSGQTTLLTQILNWVCHGLTQLAVVIAMYAGINKEAQTRHKVESKAPATWLGVTFFSFFFLIFPLVHILLDPDFFRHWLCCRLKFPLHFIRLRNLSASRLGKPFGRQLERKRGIEHQNVIRQAEKQEGRVRSSSNQRQKGKDWPSLAQHMAKDTSRPD